MKIYKNYSYNEFSASFEYSRDFQWPERTKTIKRKRIEDEDIVFLQILSCP